MFDRDHHVQALVRAALECTVYVAPTDPGLTGEEMTEVAARLGIERGELRAALGQEVGMHGRGDRLLPNPNRILPWLALRHEDPEYRNFEALDFVHSALHELARKEGYDRARIERGVLVERGCARGLKRHDLEVALTIFAMRNYVAEADGIVHMKPTYKNRMLPTRERDQHRVVDGTRTDEARRVAYAVVKDVVERRTDGRHAHAEPFDAFAEEIGKLGYGQFRVWWQQLVSEVRLGSHLTTPLSVSVASAALVEGALTFVVPHARRLGLGVMGSRTFEDDPRTWKIDDLVKSAASGQGAAILDAASAARVKGLIRTRQRIHAGGMLSEFPSGVPDLRPDEAREAVAVAEMVVRRVLDWLRRHPPS